MTAVPFQAAEVNGAEAPLSRAPITSARDSMLADTTLSETAKSQLDGRYEEALAFLSSAETFEQRTREFDVSLTEAPEETIRLLESLRNLTENPPEPEIGDLDFQTLHSRIEKARTRIELLQTGLAKFTEQLEDLSARPTAIGERISVIDVELQRVERSLAVPELAGDTLTPGRTADRFFLGAQQSLLSSERQMLQAELRSQTEREALIRVQRDMAERQLEITRSELEILNRFSNEQTQSEVERLELLIGRLTSRPEASSPLYDGLVAELKDLLASFQTLPGRVQEASSLQESAERSLRILQHEVALADLKFHFGQGGESMVPVLFDLYRRVRSQRIPYERTMQSRLLLDEARLSALVVESQWQEQSELERLAAEEYNPTITDLLEVRRELLQIMRVQYSPLIRELARYQSTVEGSLSQSEQAKQSLAKQLFLVRSVPVIGQRTFQDLPEALAWYFSGGHRESFAGAIKSWAGEKRGTLVMAGLLMAVLLGLRWWLVKRLLETTRQSRRVSQDHYGLTAIALGCTVLLALPLPLLLWALNSALSAVPESNDWLWGMRLALPDLVMITFAVCLLLEVSRDQGLAAHFRWRHDPVLQLRKGLLVGFGLYVPSILITTSCVFGDGSVYLESLGRLAFITAHSVLAWIAWRLLGPMKWGGNRETKWLPFLQGLKVSFGAGVPAALALMAASGYLVTAISLSRDWVMVLGIFAGGNLAYWLTLRWFAIRQRQLTLETVLDKRKRARVDAKEIGTGLEFAKGEESSGEEEEDVDLESIGKQTRDLLGTSYTLVASALVLLYLNQSIPALDTIDEWLVLGDLSLLELVQIVFTLIATVTAASNFPGLLELVVLHPMKIAMGTRSAIRSLVQYAISLLGGMIVLSILRVDWTQFGWIAAALSVGIGFGLQEVITNFVCGLLLLFERPIRVGDIVTIEGTTGTVTRIQMRATTITNWDRQELIMPNKLFITGAVLNWSLSNAMNRLTIPVGIAYGSDTEKALLLLKEAAAEHPLVLDNPAPIVSFEEFGDNALNLVLRVFLPDMDNRLAVSTALHSEIQKKFDEAGIVIAFPQCDIHPGEGWERLVEKLAGREGMKKVRTEPHPPGE